MARTQPAKGGSGKGRGGSSATRARRSPSPRPQQRARVEKPGTVSKSVQEGRGRGSRFLSEVVAELRKVSWPTRPQLLQSTAVVLVVVAIVSAYLAALDEVFGRLVDAIF